MITASGASEQPEALTPWARFLICGPLSGALIGSLQASAAMTVWLISGQPDFYFRGWSGVQVHFTIWTLGGGLVGVPFGLALLWFERGPRRIRLPLFLPLVLAGSLLASIVIVSMEFRQGRLLTSPALSEEILAPLVGFVCAGVASRRVPTQIQC